MIGSAIGWFIGQQVYRTHHDPEIGGGAWERLSGKDISEDRRQPRDMGSTYVPLDSWVYAVLSRLAALGYITTAMEGLQPWTRMECATLTVEASDNLTSGMVMEATAEATDKPLAGRVCP